MNKRILVLLLSTVLAILFWSPSSSNTQNIEAAAAVEYEIKQSQTSEIRTQNYRRWPWPDGVRRQLSTHSSRNDIWHGSISGHGIDFGIFKTSNIFEENLDILAIANGKITYYCEGSVQETTAKKNINVAIVKIEHDADTTVSYIHLNADTVPAWIKTVATATQEDKQKYYKVVTGTYLGKTATGTFSRKGEGVTCQQETGGQEYTEDTHLHLDMNSSSTAQFDKFELTSTSSLDCFKNVHDSSDKRCAGAYITSNTFKVECDAKVHLAQSQLCSTTATVYTKNRFPIFSTPSDEVHVGHVKAFSIGQTTSDVLPQVHSSGTYWYVIFNQGSLEQIDPNIPLSPEQGYWIREADITEYGHTPYVDYQLGQTHYHDVVSLTNAGIYQGSTQDGLAYFKPDDVQTFGESVLVAHRILKGGDHQGVYTPDENNPLQIFYYPNPNDSSPTRTLINNAAHILNADGLLDQFVYSNEKPRIDYQDGNGPQEYDCMTTPCLIADAPVVRERTIALFMNILNYSKCGSVGQNCSDWGSQNDCNLGGQTQFTDVSSNSPYYESVMQACRLGIVRGYQSSCPNNAAKPCFGPVEGITRAQWATIASRTFFKMCEGSGCRSTSARGIASSQDGFRASSTLVEARENIFEETAVSPPHESYEYKVDTTSWRCGNTAPTQGIVKARFTPVDGRIRVDVRKCDDSAFTKNGILRITVDELKNHTYDVTPMGAECGTTGPTETRNIVSLQLVPKDSQTEIETQLRKCAGGDFNSDAKVELWIDNERRDVWIVRAGDPLYRKDFDPVGSWGLATDTASEWFDYMLKVYSTNDQNDNAKHTGIIRAKETYSYNWSDQYTYNAGQTEITFYIDPVAKGIENRHTYRIDLFPSGQHNPIMSGVIDAWDVDAPYREKVPPSTAISSMDGDLGNYDWYRSNVTIRLNATDSESGVKHVSTKIGAGNWQTHNDDSTTVTVSDEGSTLVSYRAEDEFGNLEAEKSLTVHIDKTASDVNCTEMGVQRGNIYYMGAVIVSCVGEDVLSGLSGIHYTLNSGETQLYEDAIAISTDGNHAIVYSAEDVAGNISPNQTLRFTRDTTAPTLSNFTINRGAATANAVTVQLTYDAQDAVSGLDQMCTSYNQLDWTCQPYADTMTFALPPIDHLLATVYFYVTDQAGHQSDTATDTIELDLYPEPPSSASFHLCGNVMPAAAGTSQSSSFRLTTTAGEAVAGGSVSNSFRLSSGFLAQRDGCATEPLPPNGYVLQQDVIAAAGGLATSPSFQLNGTLGEAFVGGSAKPSGCLESASFRLGVGFWGCGGINSEAAPLTQQTLTFEAGWNRVSTYIVPDEADMETLFADIVDVLSIVKNGDGGVYWPEFGVNQIGDWDSTQGYQVHVTETVTLTIQGAQLRAASIALDAGWTDIPFLRTEPMAIETALASLGDTIVIVKNNHGQVYWPEFGVNGIGQMQPGQGYQIYLSAPATLTYP